MDEFKSQESCNPYFEKAYGYAVFPTIAKLGIAAVGGAGGQGDIYINKESGSPEKVGTSKMIQVSLGPQFGGQIYSLIIFFEREGDYKRFIADNFEFGADANAVALTASAGAKVSTIDNNLNIQGGVRGTKHKFKRTTNTLMYTKGMAVFTSTIGGLMYEASLSGQKFKFKALE
mmetsp:Transcript_3360/g.9341  ORF Transcript_3360/g.9341 Transcript_3360/m.9341 type:complete len:174 (-) Transcript_3360:132-653(-)|eukprot:CAMPEP_0172368840 /NCGR_PEP_ID=MMETSP1060-20121228/29598_1 /TAXON_ID=37318 /ORGANISM="Pseudo-nitzschia pungens, Strain cf. cingulata" /LENGTH=173 /DNA_ID=CAMNT_0013093577 /DNA_START=261 /DNA_END=782 /DNA_ORIENTATION=+